MPEAIHPTNAKNNVAECRSEYQWKSLGKGSYNLVWVSNFTDVQFDPTTDYKGPWVLKYPIPPRSMTESDTINSPSRSVRIWKELNPQLPAATIYKHGAVFPYISNSRQATDDEIVSKLIQIYVKNRRIVVDAAISGNFLTNIDTREVTLVDVPLALKRSSSSSSLFFAKNLKDRFASYWLDPQLNKSMPNTLTITQNLLYLEDQLDIQFIDNLCEQGQLTRENIHALTWLRVNDKRLTSDLFREIDTLNQSGINVTDTLLESLVDSVEVELKYSTVIISAVPKHSDQLEDNHHSAAMAYNRISL